MRFKILVNFLVCLLTAKADIDFDAEHDFVVVGGGSAGCVVASRLSEIPEFDVLLLEAGGKPPLTSKMPATPVLLMFTENDWSYFTVSQKHAMLSQPEQKSFWPRGKMLGGSGSLNGMIYARGSKQDYDSWGINEWNWENVFPYLLKMEDNKIERLDEKFHAKGGPMTVTEPGRSNTIIGSFLKAVKAMGYEEDDPNDGSLRGFHYLPLNLHNGKRISSYTAYLKKVLYRDNLKVETHAFVEKILFNDKKEAIGVLYNKDGKKYKVRARKEVILSAGAVNSPKLLMLSGVGPKEHLESLNIDLIADLPVGLNLQDHVGVTLAAFAKPYEEIFTNETIANYCLNKKGPLTQFNFGNAFVNTKYAEENGENPDAQLVIHPLYFPILKETNEAYAFLVAIVTRPKSRGFIQLASADPYEPPLIDPRYLEDEHDVKVLIEGTKMILDIQNKMDLSDTDYIKKNIDIPACKNHDLRSDEYYACFVRQMTNTDFHPIGTCKMGSSGDKTSVVDTNLNVIGIKHLRVIDASVIPKIPSTPTQIPTMMIAEKASDIIKQAYQHKTKTEFKQEL